MDVLGWLESGFASGWVVVALLGLLGVEMILIALLRARLGWGRAIADALLITLPGVFLMLALLAAILDAPWHLIALALTGAGLTHATDLIRRLRA